MQCRGRKPLSTSGEYFLAALTDVEPDDLHDPDFLGQVVASAVRVTVGEGEETIQNLRIKGR